MNHVSYRCGSHENLYAGSSIVIESQLDMEQMTESMTYL
ncbi:unnamed protein product [Haemonchus placei]|uniref:Uncharacterized protein n=1 Tax=Haemonchus placei TaxID=6290 RepID=A0A0N4WX76_HAEPC|nr:unnamed protein product [Haemonchus placei]